MTNSMRMVETSKIVQGLAPILPSSSTPDYVSLKDYGRVTVIIEVDNGSTVTGSAITLKQATAVAGTGEKALAFDKVWQNIDTGASDALVETAVTSDTFTTDTTDDKNLMYVIEVNTEELDSNNDFDSFRVGAADATAAVLSITYILHDARYKQTTPPTAITD